LIINNILKENNSINNNDNIYNVNISLGIAVIFVDVIIFSTLRNLTLLWEKIKKIPKERILQKNVKMYTSSVIDFLNDSERILNFIMINIENYKNNKDEIIEKLIQKEKEKEKLKLKLSRSKEKDKNEQIDWLIRNAIQIQLLIYTESKKKINNNNVNNINSDLKSLYEEAKIMKKLFSDNNNNNNNEEKKINIPSDVLSFPLPSLSSYCSVINTKSNFW
jgi:HD superfamily phosphohydrolase